MINDFTKWITTLEETLTDVETTLGAGKKESSNKTFLYELKYLTSGVTSFLSTHSTDILVGAAGALLATSYYRSSYSPTLITEKVGKKKKKK